MIFPLFLFFFLVVSCEECQNLSVKTTFELAKVFVKMPRVKSTSKEAPTCVMIRVRSDNDGPGFWNYDIPPTPHSDTIVKRCVSDGFNFHSAMITAQPLEIDLPIGFHTVTSYIEDKNGNCLSEIEVNHVKIEKENEVFALKDTQLQIKWKEQLQEKDSQIKTSHEEILRSQYSLKHKNLAHFDTKFLDSNFHAAIKHGDFESVLKKESEESKLFSVKVFTEEFCEMFLDEVHNVHSSGVDFSRPNSMNNYGLVLNEVGVGDFAQEFMEYIKPLAIYLFPEWRPDTLDSQHSFTIRYKPTEDKDLAYHMDQSEITFNLCLFTDATENNVFFNGARDTKAENKENVQVSPQIGTALIHVGQHWHGATKIGDGQRHNLVMWFRSSEYKKSATEQFLQHCDKSKSHDEL